MFGVSEEIRNLSYKIEKLIKHDRKIQKQIEAEVERQIKKYFEAQEIKPRVQQLSPEDLYIESPEDLYIESPEDLYVESPEDLYVESKSHEEVRQSIKRRAYII